MWFGKIYQQNFHNWGHLWSWARLRYLKDAEWTIFGAFYDALHNNLPSEKIIGWYNNGRGGEDQIWEDLIDLSSYLVLITIIMMLVLSLIHILVRYILRVYMLGFVGVVGLSGLMIKMVLVLGFGFIMHYTTPHLLVRR